MHKLGRHIQHYLPLIAVLGMSIVGVFYFSYDKEFQGAIIAAAGAGYISWGIVHHYIHGDLSTAIVAEYSAIAILGFVIMYTLLFI